MKNPNHPKKGSVIKVEPIRDLDDIAKLKEVLKTNKQHLAIFVLGINTNLRASDLVKLKVKDVKDLEPFDTLPMREQKTRKARGLVLNKNCVKVIQELLKTTDDNRIYLFEQKTENKPLTVPHLSLMVKRWCKRIGLKGNYASHSLRKTFGYHQYRTFGMLLPDLMYIYNHSNERQTLDYLCICQEDIIKVYENEL